MSYQVLLVDDEPSALDILRALVDWQALGFTVGACAANGREGLKAFRRLRPDLVITDIQMPVMDGLDMIRQIRTVDRNARFIILSCHENFYYARQSIQLGVSDYLVKDLLTQEELTWQLGNLKQQLQNAPIQTAAGPEAFLSQVAVRYHRARTLWESAFCRQLSADELRQSLDQAWGNTEHVPLAFMELLAEPVGEAPADLQQAAAAVDLALDGLWGGEVYRVGEGQLSAVICLESITSQLKLLGDCNLVCQRVRTALPADQWRVTIGLSHPFLGLEEIWKYRAQAEEALRQRIFYGKEKNIFYHYVNGVSGSRSDQSIQRCMSAISEAVAGGSLSGLSQAVEQLYNPLISGFMKYNYIKEVNSRMFGLLVELLVKQGASFDAFFGCGHLPFEEVDQLETVEEMAGWFVERLSRLMTAALNRTVSPYGRRVAEAVSYIETHYAQDISLEVVSDHLRIHKGYLCRIFKQETGQNITDYIIALRIGQAKKLMTTTGQKLYQIAEEVGFASPQQFNLYFKRLEGEPPAQWLKSQGRI